MNVKCDDVCKDISRLSFAPMKSEILYFNPSLLFAELPEASDYPDGSLFSTTSPYGYSPCPGESAESAEGVTESTVPLRQLRQGDADAKGASVATAARSISAACDKGEVPFPEKVDSFYRSIQTQHGTQCLSAPRVV